jgi:hypothetical protein
MTRRQLDPSTHAPWTNNALALGCPPPVPAWAEPARPEAWTAARPAAAAVPCNTARRVDLPIGPSSKPPTPRPLNTTTPH